MANDAPRMEPIELRFLGVDVCDIVLSSCSFFYAPGYLCVDFSVGFPYHKNE